VILEPVLSSAAMKKLDRTLRLVADKDVTITLIGESGSGKEVLARRIHELSSRRAAPFVPINCAAIPETLFESELFGHEKGAFTGADQLVRGKIEAANTGTLFLDEIGEMPIQAQAKLLRFLEGRKFMRVGGSSKVAVDVRLISATLRPLDQEVEAGRFRADLYYRIQGVVLDIPPLRQRAADLEPLIQQFVAELAAKHRVKPPRFTRGAIAALRGYPWPGNVRELRNTVELLCLLRAGKVVRAQDLADRIRAAPPAAKLGDVLEISLSDPLDDSIDAIIRAAVELEGGNRSRAAERLHIGLRTVQRRLKRD
jgi:DNA-binding NtrC family response regulator